MPEPAQLESIVNGVLNSPDAMSLVAAERIRQHEKIVRLRALREAAEAAEASHERKKTTRPSRPWIPA